MSKFIMLVFAICIKQKVRLMGAGKLKYVKTQDNNKTLVMVRTIHMEFGGKETVGIANPINNMPMVLKYNETLEFKVEAPVIDHQKLCYGTPEGMMDVVSIELLNRKDEDNGSSWLGEGKVNGSSFPKEDNGTFPREEDVLVEEEPPDVDDIKTVPPGVREEVAAHVGHVGEGTGLPAEEEEDEIGCPTSYGGMTPYECGGKTSIEETKMKHDITIETEMKHLYETSVGKELYWDQPKTDSANIVSSSMLMQAQYIKAH